MSLKRKFATIKGEKADVSSVSTLVRAIELSNARNVNFLPFTVANLRFQLSC